MKTRSIKTLTVSIFFLLFLMLPLATFAETPDSPSDAERKHWQYLKKRFSEMQAESKKAKQKKNSAQFVTPQPVASRLDKYVNMSAEEKEMMLTYLCETSRECRNDYQAENDQLARSYKDKRHWGQSFFGTDRELVDEYCTARNISLPNCGRNFVGNEYYIRLLKQLELLRSFAPSQKLISASKPLTSKLPLEDLETLAKTKLVAFFPYDETGVEKLLDLSGLYDLYLKYLIATRIAVTWTFSADHPEAGQNIKKSWFTDQGWQRLNELQVMQNIKRTMEFSPVGIETLITHSDDGFTHISQESAELMKVPLVWKYKVYLSHSICDPKQFYLRAVDGSTVLELTILLDMQEGKAKDFLISDVRQLPY